MDISGMVSYDLGSRSQTSGPSPRSMMAPQLDVNMQSYSNPAIGTIPTYHSNPYGNYGQSVANNYHMVPAYNNGYSPIAHSQIAHPQALPTGAIIPQGLPHIRDSRNSFPRLDTNSLGKDESSADPRSASMWDAPQESEVSPEPKMSSPTSASDIAFATDVDSLMKAIQAKSTPAPQRPLPALTPTRQEGNYYGSHFVPGYGAVADKATSPVSPQDDKPTPGQKEKKRYECDIPGCNKSFLQKTHLEIHIRAHTGDKPFLCKEPSCGQRFSQLGNLKTHERRHTGEKPYCCDICGKRFAQRGNVRAHKIVHDQLKPFTCKLENCHKQFTQLGNLKSHQNKFHAGALKNLTQKFLNMREGDPVSSKDKELWEYFAELYKNSNKGIKGRGKDRKIGPSSKASKDEGDFGGGHDNGDDRSTQMSMSPSSGGSHHSNHDGYDFASVELDDGSSVGSGYDAVSQHHHHQHHQQQQQQHLHQQQQQHQQQIPLTRSPVNVGQDPMGVYANANNPHVRDASAARYGYADNRKLY